MGLLNDCSSNLYVTLPACTPSFLVKLPGLEANTPYHYIIEDKFGHIYHEEVVTDDQGGFIVDASVFPDGMFNPYIGQLMMEVKEGMGYCSSVEFTVCGAAYSKIVISFKDGELSNQIPCIC